MLCSPNLTLGSKREYSYLAMAGVYLRAILLATVKESPNEKPLV